MTLGTDSKTNIQTSGANPYLSGKYAPVQREIEAQELPVIGEVPDDLFGVYVRNGPNPRFQAPGRYHWFDGDGMLHSVFIREGKVSYRNRYVRTAAFQREAEAGKALWSGVMESRKTNPADMPLKDTANTDVLYYRGQLMALWYMSGAAYCVDPLTLETTGIETFEGRLPNKISAHAKVDHQTGELFFFDYGPVAPYLFYGVASPQGRLKHYLPVELPGLRSPHDLAITQNYALLFDLPFFTDEAALKKGRTRVTFHPEIPSRFGIIPRYGPTQALRWFEAEPCYMYHTVNAWEEGDEIVLDGCRVAQPEPTANGTNELERMLSYLRVEARLYRWRFNLRTGQVKEGPLDDRNTEFPTMNRARWGQPTRYAYHITIAGEQPALLFDGLVKYDTTSNSTWEYGFGKGRYGSEAAFAPRPNPKAEDDGYLLTFIHDDNLDQSELLILDARDVQSGPLSRVILPQRVPQGFHACWIPGEELRQN
jgi:carotenoid cleavage dioxygenase